MKNLNEAERRLFFKILGHLIVLMVLLSMIVFVSFKCGNKRATEILKPNIEMFENQIDSLRLANDSLEQSKTYLLLEVDSLKAESSKLEVTNKSLKKSIKNLQMKVDSIEVPEVCEEIVDSYKELNDSLYKQVEVLEGTVEVWKTTYQLTDSVLTLCEEQRINDQSIIINKDSIINTWEDFATKQLELNAQLQKQIKKEKNRTTTTYIIGGTVIGGLLAWMLVK